MSPRREGGHEMENWTGHNRCNDEEDELKEHKQSFENQHKIKSYRDVFIEHSQTGQLVEERKQQRNKDQNNSQNIERKQEEPKRDQKPRCYKCLETGHEKE